MNETEADSGSRIADSRRLKAAFAAVACAAGVMVAGVAVLPLPDPPPSHLEGQGGDKSFLANLPLHFEPTREAGSYLARGRDYTLELDASGATLHLKRGGDVASLGLQLIGAQAASVRGEHKLPGVSNYFLGADASQWRESVPHYARVRYEGVYPGVDLVYYGAGRDLEYDFIVAPGADPEQIQLSYRGAQDVRIDDDGNLHVTVDAGDVVHRRPVVYQTLAHGVRASVEGAFRLVQRASDAAAAIVAFDLGAYDARLPLVIDPVLTYSSYLGSTDEDEIVALFVDAAGAVYVMGNTESASFPVTAGAAQTVHGSPGGSDNDVFIAKINPQGAALEYSTFLGGDENDVAAAIHVDAAGAAYVAGRTFSGNFPTASAFDTTYGGGNGGDIFVAHLNAQGAALLYSTYLGGAGAEAGASGGSELGLRVDSSGSVWILSTTESNDYPVTAGAPQATRGGDPSLFADDFVITRLSANGSSLLFSTYYGGPGNEELGFGQHEPARAGFHVADSGVATFVGASGAGFPTTAGVVQTTHGGSEDAVAVQINTATNSVAFSTYLGGSGFERVGGSALDAAGNLYICGETQGPDFPTTPGAFDTTAADRDAYVSKLNPTATALIYSTLLGGADADFDAMCRVDAAGAVYIAGSTGSTDFPVTTGAFDTASDFDSGFLAKLNPAGSALIYASYLADEVDFLEINSSGEAHVAFRTVDSDLLVTPGGRPYAVNEDVYFLRLNAAGSAGLDASYLGGSDEEIINAFVLAASGDVYVAGSTDSDDFDVTAGAVQTISGNPGSGADDDAFIARFAMGDGGSPPPTPQPGVVQLSAATYSASENGGSVTLTLTRTGGADGAISVNVASGGGSAAAGNDYNPLAQTVNWANGDAAAKTVSLGIINDSTDEPDETVTVALSNATGGAALGATSSATVTIVDDDPPAVAPPPAPPPAAQNGGARGSYGGGAMGGIFLLAGFAFAALARARRALTSSSSRKRGPILKDKMDPRLRGDGGNCRAAHIIGTVAAVRAPVAAALLLTVGTAHAADDRASGWYVGVRGGLAESTLDEGDLERALAVRGHSVTVNLDDQEPTWSVFGGYRWASGLGLEANVVDLGEYDVTIGGSSNAPGALLADARSLLADAGRGAGVALSWRWALGERFAVIPRVGGYYWESERTLTSGAQSIRRTENGLNLMGGVAFGVELTRSWSLALGWDVYDAGGRNDLRGYSASLEYRFGR